MARREQLAAGPGSRALIVDIVRSAGPISRVELAEHTGLTQPAVSGIVRKLIDDGVVRETGELASTRGKPRTLLEINSRAAYGIGVQVGFDTITCIATDTTGGVIGRQSIASSSAGDPEAVADRVAELYDQVIGGLGLAAASIAGLAIVAPGVIDVRGGRIHGSQSMEQWRGFELRDHLQQRLGIPVLVDGDAAAAAIGEFWSRQVSRDETFGVIYMGRGIGAGIVIDGSLLRGSSSNAAELGHVSIESGGRECFCGNRGCLERYAAPPAVVEEARGIPALAALLEAHTAGDAEAFDRIARAAVNGQSDAHALIERSASKLAEAALTYANLLDFDRIVLAGPGFAIAGSIYARAIQDRLAASAFARSLHPTKVELASDPRDSAAIGAAALVLQGSVAPGHGPRMMPTH